MSEQNRPPASKISIEQVRHVARLARLELDPADEQSLQANLSEILTYIDKLNELDTANVPPTAQVGEAGTPMRDDVVTNPPAADEMRRQQRPCPRGPFLQRCPKSSRGDDARRSDISLPSSC